MQETLFWFDLETTGTNPATDRIVQFAGVRTDLDLKPLSEPVNIFCSLSDDVIPSAEAMLVTGIGPARLEREGMSEREFAEGVVQELGEARTCVVGFNNIRFDDEFVRYLLYRNFHDPYAREWANGNSRWDVIDCFRMARALRPDGLSWPENEKGHPTFRLERLTAANGVGHADAHDAVSDVLATVTMTAKLRAAQPRLYDYLFRLKNKNAAADQVYPLGKSALLHVSNMYPNERSCAAIVMPVCQHPRNPNGIICYDLSVDPTPLMTSNAARVQHLTFTPRSELAEGEQRIPLKVMHLNRCPAVAPLKTLDPDSAARLGLDPDQAQRHLAALQGSAGLVDKVQAAYGAREFAPVTDPDRMLYAGDFFSDDDRARCARLRTLGADALGSDPPPFDDARIPEMLFRYRARNFGDSLNRAETQRWHDYLRGKWADGEAIKRARDEITALRDTATADQHGLLDQLETRLDRQTALLDAPGRENG
ncbi:MAG: exodeoxyribonuclease I [Gammaproteobacteria bacterium]|nr:exodeoxyribonuclease I [Gammaproteobacteria bacterium]